MTGLALGKGVWKLAPKASVSLGRGIGRYEVEDKQAPKTRVGVIPCWTTLGPDSGAGQF